MNAEHFIYGLFERYGFRLIKSPGLANLLSGDIIDYLRLLKEKEDPYMLLWPNGVITVTRVEHTQDEHGRDGVWNSTIAVSLMDYLAYTDPVKTLSPHLTGKLDKPVERLEPLHIP